MSKNQNQNQIDVSKLTPEQMAAILQQVDVKTLKATLKDKKADAVEANYAESRATKIAKARMFASYWEDLAVKAQQKLDATLEQRDKAWASLKEKEDKWLKSIPEDVMTAAMDEAIKAKNAADAKTQKSTKSGK